ncbi:hypothetical protein AOC36_04025 [Erysipelothrix larvae]|uniref:Uncharacterized protein n=1 Tax=Erysipelothrix larvae TaxID=1514105 RepID=A0A109UGS0_9FIRM|nr:hypothetical protein [Erysipelothrix larvae]AMC93167.1 hypothetical protein AOC36_04025 [Erysipelothrix larvae]
MSKLSKREVLLLFMLGFVLIIGVGVPLWIVPLQEEINTLSLEKSTLDQEKMRIESLINQEDALSERKLESIKETDDLLSKISVRVKPSEFDQFLNDTLSTAGFTIQSISYGEIAPTVPQVISADESTVEYSLKTLFDQYKNVKSEGGTSETIADELLKQTITITMNGSEANLPQLIDTVNEMGNTYFISSIAYTKGDATSTITLNLDIYFID